MNGGGSTEYALRTARQRGVTFIRLWYVDVLGAIKGVAFPVSEMEHVIAEGIGVDGSALEGGVRLSEIDVVAHPDVSSFQILPWRDGANVARMFADLRSPDGQPFDGDPRAALAAVIDEAARRGLHVQVGAELEFYLFRALPDDGSPPVPFEGGGYFDLTPVDIATDFRKQMIEFLEALGVSVKGSYHEAGPSQQEVVLKHADALTTADAILTFRMAVKQAAFSLGTYSSFMPKPLEGQPGSGMHLHLSVLDDEERNLFHAEGGAPGELSTAGRRFMAGLLAHAAEMSVVTNQWVNSYTRLADGFEAPAAVTWSHRHPNPLVRVPGWRAEHPDAARVELRSPDAGANPYLVLALAIAAGLRGMDQAYDLPPETDERDPGRPRLPQDLREATDLLEASTLAREVLGERIVRWLVANKRREWDAYSRTVSEFERRHYLPLL